MQTYRFQLVPQGDTYPPITEIHADRIELVEMREDDSRKEYILHRDDVEVARFQQPWVLAWWMSSSAEDGYEPEIVIP